MQIRFCDSHFLGRRVGLSKVQPGELKVKALTDFRRQSCRKKLHSFLGLASYFRKFIPTYTHITSALSEMMKKCNELFWSEAAEKAFLAIKSVLASRPVLRPPNFELPFGIAVDASNLAISCVLFQVYDNLEHPVCYFSKLLNKHQRGCSTVEKEAMALRQAVLQFRV